MPWEVAERRARWPGSHYTSVRDVGKGDASVLAKANLGGTMKTSRASRTLVACALFVVGAIALVGPPPASAAAPKLDNGIGTQAALANPNCDPQTKQIKILLIARAPCVKDVPPPRTVAARPPG